MKELITNTSNELKRPRFILAAFFSVITSIAYLFTDKMDGNQYIVVIGTVLSLYGAHALIRGSKGV